MGRSDCPGWSSLIYNVLHCSRIGTPSLCGRILGNSLAKAGLKGNLGGLVRTSPPTSILRGRMEFNWKLFEEAKNLTLGDLEALIGGLAEPGKMPWYSYSTPAENCQIGSKLRKVAGSPCDTCYALGGRYRFFRVKNALARRFERMQNFPRFAEYFSALLFKRAEKVKPKDRFFRWFDAGDIQNENDLDIICFIALANPGISFWLPSQEHEIIAGYGYHFPSNLLVRLSSRRKRKAAPITDYSVGSSIGGPGYVCEADKREHTCGPCRACWDPKVRNISYPENKNKSLTQWSKRV